MKKLYCTSCGSTSVSIGKEHYTCNHCGTQHRLPKKEDIPTEKPYLSFKVKVFIAIVILNILALNYYFFIYNEAEVHVSKTKELKKVQTMSFWNIAYDLELLSHIDDLKTTDNKTYLISGHNNWQNIWMAELDEKGEELWHKNFPDNVNGDSRVLDLKDGYIISSSGFHDSKTIKLNKSRDVVFTSAFYFESMLALGGEFIGVSKNKIIRIDEEGKIAWQQSFSSQFDKVIMINDGNLIALGKTDKAKLGLVKFTKDGTVIWNKEIYLSRFYHAEGAVATHDGGFIINARGKIKILKFSSDGILEFKTVIDDYLSSYARAIIEVKDGYITTSQISSSFDRSKSSSDILVAKLDFDGNIVWKKIYKSDKRLHADNIVKAYDGGYLLSVNTEIKNPWLVKMDERGEIQCRFPDQNNLDNKTTFKTSKASREPLRFIKNISPYLGAGLKMISYSKDKKYLYTIGGATGFKIFDVSNEKNIVEIGSFLKTKLTLKVTPNYIGPVGRKYAGEGDFKYDSPYKLVISKDETKAYICDISHGFYILDISNKSNPKLLGTIKGLKVKTFVLSKDENTMYTYYDKKLISIDVSQPKLLYKQEKKYTVDEWNNFVVDMKLAKSGENIFIADGKKFMLYSIEENRDTTHYLAPNGISKMKITDDEKLAYLLKSNKGIDIIDIEDHDNIKIKNQILIKGRFSSFDVSKENKTLYVSAKEGMKIIDITNPLNAKVTNTYTDDGRNYVNSIFLDEDTKKIFVAFANPSAIGVVDY